jgi:hypothetical protein
VAVKIKRRILLKKPYPYLTIFKKTKPPLILLQDHGFDFEKIFWLRFANEFKDFLLF